eukprot:300136-Prymnesium_polylepis.1
MTRPSRTIRSPARFAEDKESVARAASAPGRIDKPKKAAHKAAKVVEALDKEDPAGAAVEGDESIAAVT